MKTLLGPTLLILALWSCNTSYPDSTNLIKAASLEKKVDSLQRIVDSLKIAKFPPRRLNKKLINGRQNKLNSPIYAVTQAETKKVNANRQTEHQMPTAVASSGRCLGITKKGAQCKRSVSSVSYCWQHS